MAAKRRRSGGGSSKAQTPAKPKAPREPWGHTGKGKSPPIPIDAERELLLEEMRVAVKEYMSENTWRRGRKLGITPEITGTICFWVRLGNDLRVAALTAGVPRSTFYSWLEMADLYHRKQPGGNRVAALFLDALERACAEFESQSVAWIAAAGRTQWAARAWLLARRVPQRWGETRIDPSVTGPGSSTPAQLPPPTPRDVAASGGGSALRIYIPSKSAMINAAMPDRSPAAIEGELVDQAGKKPSK